MIAIIKTTNGEVRGHKVNSFRLTENVLALISTEGDYLDFFVDNLLEVKIDGVTYYKGVI